MKKFVCILTLALLSQGSYAASVDSHAPAGVDYDHAHHKGEWMVGYGYTTAAKRGSLQQAGKTLASSDAALSKYSMTSNQDSMTMHMLHLMYAPTDKLTLSVMPMYSTMRMNMVNNPHATASGHGHSATIHAGKVSGLGDTQIGATYRFMDTPKHQLIGTLGFLAPTGEDMKVEADGATPVGYGMQLGNGMWQALPSVTYKYKLDAITVAGQVSAKQRLESLNDHGYSTGDTIQTTAWSSYVHNSDVSTSIRATYKKDEGIKGHYNRPHAHSMPEHFASNYGSEVTTIGLGANALPSTGALKGLFMGIEYQVPVHQHLKGVQLESNHAITVKVSKVF